MDEVERHVRREERPVDAEERVALDPRHLALRPGVGGRPLPPAHEVRERVVDDRDLRLRGPRREEERGALPHAPRDLPGHARALGDRPVELDEAEAPRLVAGAHRVVRVGADRLRPPREGAPGPDPQVLRGDGRRDVEGDRPEARLQLADPEAAPAPREAERAREVEERPAPLDVAVHEGRVLRVEGRPVVVDLGRHRPVVRLALPVVRRGEEARRRRRGSWPRGPGRRAWPPRSAPAGPRRACRR